MQGAFRDDLGEAEAWAIMGVNVFLGLRFAIRARSGDPATAQVAAIANGLFACGISASPGPNRRLAG